VNRQEVRDIPVSRLPQLFKQGGQGFMCPFTGEVVPDGELAKAEVIQVLYMSRSRGAVSGVTVITTPLILTREKCSFGPNPSFALV